VKTSLRFAPHLLFATLTLVAACSSDGDDAPAGTTSGGIAGSSGKTSVGGSTSTGGKTTSATGGASTITSGGTTATGGAATAGSANVATGGTATGGAATGGASTAQGGAPGAGKASTGGAATGGTATTAGAGGTSAGAPSTGGKSSAGAGGNTAIAGTGSSAGNTSLGGTAGAHSGGVAGLAGTPNGGVAGSGVAGTAGVAGSATGAVPGWTCPAGNYGTGDGCDCGCGVTDQDCIDMATQFGTNDGDTLLWCQSFLLAGSCVPWTTSEPRWAINTNSNSKCVPAPSGWSCGLRYYNDGTCDCGCGVADGNCTGIASCRAEPVIGACSINDGSSVISSVNLGLCTSSAPSSWTCSLEAYGDGVCDYGCGAADAAGDCGSSATPRCNTLGACSRKDGCGVLMPTDKTKCVAGTWTCDPLRQGDLVCDCGCGAPDIDSTGLDDCASRDVKVCGTCGVSGSCARNCGDIDSMDNTLCN